MLMNGSTNLAEHFSQLLMPDNFDDEDFVNFSEFPSAETKHDGFLAAERSVFAIELRIKFGLYRLCFKYLSAHQSQ